MSLVGEAGQELDPFIIKVYPELRGHMILKTQWIVRQRNVQIPE